jgi:hypothetical protein
MNQAFAVSPKPAFTKYIQVRGASSVVMLRNGSCLGGVVLGRTKTSATQHPTQVNISAKSNPLTQRDQTLVYPQNQISPDSECFIFVMMGKPQLRRKARNPVLAQMTKAPHCACSSEECVTASLCGTVRSRPGIWVCFKSQTLYLRCTYVWVCTCNVTETPSPRGPLRLFSAPGTCDVRWELDGYC